MMERLLNDSEKGEELKRNIESIREKINSAALRAGRDPEEIRLMAVTKTVSPERINQAFRCGICLFGENRVQEYLAKKDEIQPGAEFHLIGHLQSNKVSNIVGRVSMIQSVDSTEIARKISDRSLRLGIATDILLEVNIAGEASKTGFSKEELPEKAMEICEFPGVKIRGIMSIPPICGNFGQKILYFSSIYKLFIDIRGKKMDNIPMDILSMGMSDDFEPAIESGSNLIRIGSAIFGKRM